MLNLFNLSLAIAVATMLSTAAAAAVSLNIGTAYIILTVLLATASGLGWACLLYKLSWMLENMRKVNFDFFNKHPRLEDLLVLGEFFFIVIISPFLAGVIGYQGVIVIVKVFAE